MLQTFSPRGFIASCLRNQCNLRHLGSPQTPSTAPKTDRARSTAGQRPGLCCRTSPPRSATWSPRSTVRWRRCWSPGEMIITTDLPTNYSQVTSRGFHQNFHPELSFSYRGRQKKSVSSVCSACTVSLSVNIQDLFFRLIQQPNCIKVPKEVCVNERVNPKKVAQQSELSVLI